MYAHVHVHTLIHRFQISGLRGESRVGFKGFGLFSRSLVVGVCEVFFFKKGLFRLGLVIYFT